jgi:hypothetical protein
MRSLEIDWIYLLTRAGVDHGRSASDVLTSQVSPKAALRRVCTLNVEMVRIGLEISHAPAYGEGA